MSLEHQINPQLKQNLNKLIKYDKKTFPNLVLSRLKEPLNNQVQKIDSKHARQSRKEFNQQQLLILVLNNHVKAIIDLKTADGSYIETHIVQNHTVVQNNIEQFQILIKQYSRTDEQLNRIIIVNQDFSSAIITIDKLIKKANQGSYDANVVKYVQSRLRLLEIIHKLLITYSSKPESQIKNNGLPDNLELKKGVFSFKDLQANDVHLIIQQLDQKVQQLSTICEQIPQLQTFKRTLDLTMPEHNVNFTKIVDVLIELHHKVNKLISRRPQKLLKQIQAVQKQCQIIQKATDQFISKLESEQQMQIKIIYFDQKKNKSPDYFRRIQKNIVKISQHMIYCLNMESQYEEKMVDIRGLIELFYKIVSNLQDNYERQWKKFRNKDQISQEQQKIIQILEHCIQIVQNNKEQLARVRQEYQSRIQQIENDTYNNVGYLQEDINKMSQQIEELKRMISEYQQQRIGLKQQISELKKKNYEIFQKYKVEIASFQKDVLNLEKQNKFLKLQISELQSKLQGHQNNNNMTDDSYLKTIQAQLKTLARQKQQWSRLEIQLNRRIQLIQKDHTIRLTEKDEQINRQKSTNLSLQSQILRLKSQLQVAEAKLTTIGGHKQTEYQTVIYQKDKTIDQLNLKLSQLNTKMSNMLKQFQSMQLQIKRKEAIQLDLKKQIDNSNNNGKYKDQLQKSKNDLDKVKIELENTNRIIGDLQNQLRRRDSVINEMQGVINNLDHQIQQILRQNQNIRNQIDLQYQKGLKQGENSKTSQFQQIKIQMIKKQQQISQLKLKLERLTELQRQIQNLKNQNTRKSAQISRLQGEIRKNQPNISNQQKIRELQAQIRSLQLSLHKQSSSKTQFLSKITKLQQQLQNLRKQIGDKDSRIRDLESQISTKRSQLQKQQNQINSLKNGPAQNQKQIQYLKQKIRSLQELIEIFTEQHAILQAKIKQYRLKQNRSIEIINKNNSDIIQLKRILDIRDNELNQMRNSRFTINANTFDESSKKNQDKIHHIQNQLIIMNNRLSESHVRYEDQTKIWTQKQRNYLNQIQKLKAQITSIQKTSQSQTQAQTGDKYYLRIQGQKLQELIKRMQSGSSLMNEKVDQLLSNSRSRINLSYESGDNDQIKHLTEQNRLLIQEVRKLMSQKKEAAEILKIYPNPDFLTEFIFRVIIFFSELHPESSQGKAVWEQLANIRKSYEGSQYFVVLEDFTKFYLEENTIQVYRRKLKEKAQQLQILKQRLDKFLQQKIKSEETVYQTTILSESRAKLFRQRYLSHSRGNSTVK